MASNASWQPIVTSKGSSSPPGAREAAERERTWRLDREHALTTVDNVVNELLGNLALAAPDREAVAAALARAFAQGLDYGWSAALGEAVNAGAGFHLEVQEYAATLDAVAGGARPDQPTTDL